MTPEPTRNSFFRGWGWFALPVVLNFLVVNMPIYDGGYTNAVDKYFSIPYVVIATVIGLRRGSHITLSDFLFLTFGNLAIVMLLWTLKQPSQSC
jgi:hypothetical protein